jgi:hypothetical protein
MDDFNYSLDAQNILNKFYQVDKIVYVEGEDDIPFWEIIFEKLANQKVEIKSVGGKPELEKYAESVFSGAANYLIAMDSDHDNFKKIQSHRNIIKTFGYSIENTIVTAESLAKTIKILAKLPSRDTPINECKNWLESFNELTKALVLVDLANELERAGNKVVPASCERFMKSKKAILPCKNKLNEYIKNIPLITTKEVIESNDNLFRLKGIAYAEAIRGHFLFSAASIFIRVQVKKFGKSISISTDALYASMIMALEGLFDKRHPHFSHYQNSISMADWTH